MVRVVEKSLEERAREEKHQQLVAIAKEVITTQGITIPLRVSDFMGVHIHDLSADSVISVDSSGDMIRVFKPEYFDIAMRLATTYEERIKGKEFTVKKQY